MSSSTTTRVGCGTWSVFFEGLSSGPEAALDLILKVGEDWRARVKGSLHKCSGSGGLACMDHLTCWDGKVGDCVQTGS